MWEGRDLAKKNKKIDFWKDRWCETPAYKNHNAGSSVLVARFSLRILKETKIRNGPPLFTLLAEALCERQGVAKKRDENNQRILKLWTVVPQQGQQESNATKLSESESPLPGRHTTET